MKIILFLYSASPHSSFSSARHTQGRTTRTAWEPSTNNLQVRTDFVNKEIIIVSILSPHTDIHPNFATD
jgi:hypothetical protein